jgi:arylformamidase
MDQHDTRTCRMKPGSEIITPAEAARHDALDPLAFSRMPQSVLEREYSPSSCIGGDYRPFIDAYLSRSRSARLGCAALGGVWSAHGYGPTAAERLDLCLPLPTGLAGAGKEAPGLLVFIHGGYWQELSAQESLFAAQTCIEHGQAFAALDYQLAPAASLAEIVAQCQRAMAWLFTHAGRLGFDPQRVVLAGSSAGAHLAAMLARPASPGDAGAQSPRVRAALLLSGIYQLEPLLGTSINHALGLDQASARQLSPALLSLTGFPPTLVCWGDNETEEFKRQSRSFAKTLVQAGANCESFEVAQRNHFDLVFELCDATTRLGGAMLRLLQGG